MTGKGDTPRPLSVPPDRFKANWDETFHGYVNTPGYCPAEPNPGKPSTPPPTTTDDDALRLLDDWAAPATGIPWYRRRKPPIHEPLGDPEE